MKWLKISADTPSGLLLVCRRGEPWVRVGYRAAEHGWSGWMAPEGMLPGTPTHWMPLPEPPNAD